jgi:hypothetical protein
MGFFKKLEKVVKRAAPAVLKAYAPVSPLAGVAGALLTSSQKKAKLRVQAAAVALPKGRVATVQARSIMPSGFSFVEPALSVEAGGEEAAILAWCAQQGLLTDYQPESGQAFYSPLAAGVAGASAAGTALMRLPAAAPAALVTTAIRALLAGEAAGGAAGVSGVASGLLARIGPAAVVAALGFAAIKGAPKLWRWALRKLGFKTAHRRHRRGISSSDIRRTFRTLRTVQKITARMPKARGQRGRRPFARAAGPGVQVVDVD